MPRFTFKTRLIIIFLLLGLLSAALTFWLGPLMSRPALAGIIVALFAGIGYVAARSLTNPLERILQGLHKVAEGDLTHRVSLGCRGEFHALAEAFNEMLDQLRIKTVTREYVRSIISSMNNALLVTGPLASDREAQGIRAEIRTVNRAACELLHANESDLLGEDIQRFLQLPDAPARGWLGTLVEQGYLHDVELECRTLDGRLVPAALSGALLESAEGRMGGIVCVLRDETERKAAEEQLRQNEQRLLNHNEVLRRLVKSEHLYSDDLDVVVRGITETAARTMHASGAGVWMFTEDRRFLRSIDLYDAASGRHLDRRELQVDAIPSFVRALEEDRVVAVADVSTDPRTREFTAPNVPRTGNRAFLDAPVHLDGRAAGVFSFTQADAPRKWLPEEENFAGSMADLLSTVFEAHERRRAERALKRRQQFDELAGEISAHFITLGPRRIEEGIRHALRKIGEFALADDCYIVQLSDDERESDTEYDWSASGTVHCNVHFLRQCCNADVPWVSARILERRLLRISRLSELPPEAETDRRVLAKAGVKSFITAPIEYQSRLIGFLGLDVFREEREWPADVESLLRLVCDILANSIIHQKRESALRYRVEFDELLTRIAAEFINVPLEKVRSTIVTALDQIGDFTRVDRVFAATMENDVITGTLYRRNRQGENLTGLDMRRFAWWMERLHRAEDIPVSSVSQLPPEAEAEKTILTQMGMKSILVVPMFAGRELRGFFGIGMAETERSWSADLRNLLVIVSQLFANVLEHEQVQKALHYRVAFENLLIDMSTQFISLAPGDFERGYQESLQKLGRFVGADRSYVFIFRDNLATMDNVYEWCSEGIPSLMNQRRNMPARTMPKFMEILLDGKAVHLPSRDAMPPELREERLYIEAEDIQSLMIVPIAYGGALLGFLGFDKVRVPQTWTDDSLKLLRVAGESFANALEHQWAQEALQQANEELERKVEERTRELRQKHALLVQSEKMASLGQLVAGVAHEINTPLGALKSNNDVVNRTLARLRVELELAGVALDPGLNPRAVKLFESMEKLNSVDQTATGRIAVIVNSLRTFARLDRSDQDMVNIHDGLESTLTLVHHQLKNRIEVCREYGQLPPVTCYPNQINQVFMNILVNASQAIEGTGRITIRTRTMNEQAIVEIEDTGKGIRQEDLPHIFDPGFTTKRMGVGTGLGLSIVYQIIQDHHGDIQVESTPGKGSLFRIVLPVR